ncbi:MAG: hypothetical protein AB1634_02030 [Thermodesulfobacteriota bacterium]
MRSSSSASTGCWPPGSKSRSGGTPGGSHPGRVHWLVTVLLACLAAGCGKAQHSLGLVAAGGEGICRVAVLPFRDQGKVPFGGHVVQRTFTAELIASGRFDVALEGEVLAFFRENRQLPQATLSRDFYIKMGQTMGVDAIVAGTVLGMSEGSEGRDMVVPEVAFSLELIRIRDGKPLVVTHHHRAGDEYRWLMHVGVVQTISELVSRMSKEAIEEWRILGFEGCRL